MKKIIYSVLLVASLSLTGCAVPVAQPPMPIQHGMVIGIQNTTLSVNDPNLAGAAIGGVAGGLLGHQFGHGNGKTALTVLGAVGGAAAGSQVNAQKMVPGYAVTVRGNDGQVFTFNSQNYIPLGQSVNYRNQNNHVTLY